MRAVSSVLTVNTKRSAKQFALRPRGALLYLVGMDQGATSVFPGSMIHEYLHDGRHLLGFPCH
jgi:hypothetical protein